MTSGTKVNVGTIQLSSLFEPDVLTVHQFLRVSRRKDRFEPEEKLMFAVLSDAVDCFQRYRTARNPSHRKLSADAENWIKSNDSEWPYSFEQICEYLNINPAYLRLGLLRWQGNSELQKSARKRLRAPLRFQHRVRHRRLYIRSQ